MAIYTYDPSVVYLSSGIPTFYISTASESAKVSLYRSENCIFETRMYAQKNRLTVRDLRQVIEQDMRDNYLTFAAYTLYTDDDTVVSKFNVLYCCMKFTGDNKQFLVNRFLTTSTSKQMARVKDELYFFVRKEEGVIAPRQFVTYKDATGNILLHDKQFSTRPGASGYGGVFCVEVKPNDYASLGTVLSITTMVGSRSFTHFYIEQQPSLKLFYANIFNVPEQVHLIGVTSRKTEVERSEAVIHRTTSFYDQTTTELREFESAPMSKPTADMIGEIVSSHMVNIIDQDYEDWDDLPTILITDSSVELKDAKGELNTVKLTFRYEDDSPHLPLFTEPEQPFNNVYSLPYL